MELKFLNYHSVFSMTEYGKKPEVIFDRTAQICFRILFNKLEKYKKFPKIKYKLILFKDPKPLANLKWNNYCPFSRKVIANHLLQAQKVVHELIDFSIEDTNVGDYSCYEVSLTLEANAPLAVHKYILTWTRFLYEASFSIFLMDALRLSKLPEFRFVSIANILNVVASCFPRGNANYPYFNTWHGIGMGADEEFLTSQELRKRLFKCDALNSLYTVRALNIAMLSADNRKATTFEFWESNDDFEKHRKRVYVEAFKILKQEYPYCK